MTLGPVAGARRKWEVAALALVLAVAAYARLTNLPGVFAVPGRVFLGGEDSYYHMRRVELTLERFPRVPFFDAWANAPEGALLDWPAGFDGALAALCLVGRALVAHPLTTDVTAAFSNPLLGVMAVLFVFLLGRRLQGPVVGLYAGLLAALLPLLSGYAIVGRVDHHAAEPLLVAAALLPLWRAFAEERHERRAALCCGAVLALSVAVWPGAIAVGALIGAGLIGAGLIEREQAGRVGRVGGLLFAAAALTMLPLALAHPWAWRGSFAYFAPSWLQVSGFAVAAASFGLLARVAARSALHRVLALLAPALLGGTALLALAPDLRATLSAALGYLGRSEAQISQVTESRPLLADGLATLVEQHTLLGLGAPALLAYLGWRWRRAPGPERPAWLVLCTCFAGGGVLALAQVRLGSLFAPLFCVATGMALVDLLGALRRRWGRRAWTTILVHALLLLGLLPTIALHRPVRFIGTDELVSTYDGLLWLRQRAASPGDALDPERPPAFSVLAPWQWGHWLNQISRQANVANPFGQTETNLRGVRDSARFFLESDATRAQQILARRRVRYVLVTPLLGQVELLTRHTGQPPTEYVVRQGEGPRLVQPAFFRTMAARLLHFDGRAMRLGGQRHAPLGRFRLVYECEREIVEGPRRLGACKIFEIVRGARLDGRTRPGARVQLQVRVRGRRRVLAYRDQLHADASGRYAFRVPYPTDEGQTAGGYWIAESGGVPREVQVPAAAVREGRTVNVAPAE